MNIRIINLIVILFSFGLLIAFIASNLKKGVSGIKVMLLGINITLFGGIIAVDPGSNLGGFEYLIAFTGILLSVFGLNKND